MGKNVYKSAQGKIVDMDKLRLIHENEIAVGNMKVNARGDQIGTNGKVVKSRNEVVKDHYNRTEGLIPSTTNRKQK